MDADWGSSSDEEEAQVRQAKDEAKLKETMALLDAFNKTRDVEEAKIESKYGSMDAREKFMAERSAAGGKHMWNEHKTRMGKAEEEEKDIQSTFKSYICIGVVLLFILIGAVFGLYMQFSQVLSGKNKAHIHPVGGNATTANTRSIGLPGLGLCVHLSVMQLTELVHQNSDLAENLVAAFLCITHGICSKLLRCILNPRPCTANSLGKSHMPPIGVIVGACVLGCGIPTAVRAIDRIR